MSQLSFYKILITLPGIILISCLTLHLNAQVAGKYEFISDYRPTPGTLVLSADSSVQVANRMRGFGLFLPENRPVKGVICFFMGHAVSPEVDIDERDIIGPAIQHDLAVAFVSTGNLVEFLFHREALDRLDSIFQDMVSRHDLPEDAWMFAGLSLAGTRAMKYAIHCMEDSIDAPVEPAALVLCDAPLDFFRFWRSAENVLDVNFHPNATGEAKWVRYYMSHELGGTPDEIPGVYRDYSPFCYVCPQGGHAASLHELPIRAYHEPDVNWWITNRRKDYYNMNSIDLAAMINMQLQNGNEHAELITTVGRRKKPLSENSPHSWSIVDNDELVRWFAKILSDRSD